jgi:predicted Ser/Thr protein kinase
MLVGQQFGPFTIDKELGSGAMGTVYRGHYTKTGQIMAIKIMAPGIGSTNAAAVDRFEREIAILKQLNHPNIVRFYGAGKEKGMRYFAMEYIQGESLDRVMARRGRMTWEEVVELSKQLCAALQHAHEKSIIHRDLKPSNIMVLPDGTLKLTDFGIAKAVDLDALTATNCTVGTASYMSPEQCKGTGDLTFKSDLYSLGVMIYELVTGRKPFIADNAMDMFVQHVQGTFERPSRMVLDIPVWLDTLICQLLEKKPEQRPLDAHMVANTLGAIQEKVEAQQSAGVEAVRRRFIDRAPGQKRLNEEDKDAARVLMTGKGKAKRKQTKKPFYQKVWVQALGLLVALGVVGTLLYLTFRPPSADKLYQQAKAVMQSGNEEQQDKVIEQDGVIAKYIKLYPKLDNEQSREIRAWRRQILTAQYERSLENYMQKRNAVLKVQPQNDTQKNAFDAVEAEEAGERESALKHWQTVKELDGDDSSWARVADKHLAELNAWNQIDKDFRQLYEQRIQRSSEEPTGLEPRQAQAFRAWRAENSPVGDLGLAKSLYKTLKEDLLKEPRPRNRWYLFAAAKSKQLGDQTTNPDTLKQKVGDRLKMVRQQLAKKPPEIRRLDARSVALDIVALYAGDTSMEKIVEDANKLLQEIPN